MGGLFSGSQKTKSESTTDTGPSKFQQPYLTTAFDGAQSSYNSSSGSPFYQGALYAGMTDQAKSDLGATRDYATNTGLGTANQLSGLGSSLLGNLGKAGTALDDFQTLANGDATQANITAAGKYADNPYLDAQIDAVNRDVGRTLNEQTLPGIDRQASGTGNINSSRAGVAAGIAQRGAADRMADNSATLRSQAYQSGLTLAQQDRSNQLSSLGSIANGYMGLGSQGLSAIGQGAQIGTNALNTINSANALEQADRQGQADADYATWQGNDTRESDLLSRYYNIIGSNQWGSYGTQTGTSKTTSSPGLGGLLAGGLSLAGGLGWSPLGAATKKGA